MEKRTGRERISMNGFFAAVKIKGSYRMFPLIDVTEQGVGVLFPPEINVEEGFEFSVRFDLIGPSFMRLSRTVSAEVQRETVAAEAVVRSISMDRGIMHRIGLELVFNSGDIKKDALKKIENLRNFMESQKENPVVHLEFGIEGDRESEDKRLSGFPIFEGLFFTENKVLTFLADADMEELFTNDSFVKVKIPVAENNRYMVLDGKIIGNTVFNMHRNRVEISLQIDGESDRYDFIRKTVKDFVSENNDIMKFLPLSRRV